MALLKEKTVEKSKQSSGIPKSGMLRTVSVESVRPSPHQPRRIFQPEELFALADSIKQQGLLQPIVVTCDAFGYCLVAGERRLRAAKLAGLTELPAILLPRSEADCALATLTENLQRKNLSFWEEAYGYKALIDKFGYTQSELAEKVGKKQPTVAGKLRLLRLPPAIQSKLLQAGLTERHARALLLLPNEPAQTAALEYIINKKLGIAAAERYVERLLQTPPPRKKPKALVRDRRICRNTIERALTLIRDAGIAADSKLSETDDYIEYRIRIAKQ